jgi:hypothetical protein
MGWGDVRYCFAMVILVIIITSPRLLLGDVLLFLFPWQLRQSLSYRLRLFWFISFN